MLKLILCLTNVFLVQDVLCRGIPLLDKMKLKEDVINMEQPIPLKKLQPQDHLDAVKIEQDGMLNKDFHKEAFLGNHEEIEDDAPEIAESKLKDIFHKYINF